MLEGKCGMTLCSAKACKTVLLDLTVLPLCSLHLQQAGALPGTQALDFPFLDQLNEVIPQPTTQREARKLALELEAAAERLEETRKFAEAAIKWSQALQLRRRLTTEKLRAAAALRLGYLLELMLELPEEALPWLRLAWTLAKRFDCEGAETVKAGLVLAHCLLDLYCEQEAITVLRELMEYQAECISAQNLLAWTLSLRGSEQEAESLLYLSLDSVSSEFEAAETYIYLSWVKTSGSHLAKAVESLLGENTECERFLWALRAVLLKDGVHVFGDLSELAAKIESIQHPLVESLMEAIQALIGGTQTRDMLRRRVEQERATGKSMVLARVLQLYAVAHREETDKRLGLLEEALLLYGDSGRIAPFRYAASLEEQYKVWSKGDTYLLNFLQKLQSLNPCSEAAIRSYQVLSKLRILRHDRTGAVTLATETAALVRKDTLALQAVAVHCLQHLPLQKVGVELCRELLETEDTELFADVAVRLGTCCLRNGQAEEAESLITQAQSTFNESSLEYAFCTKLLAVCAQKQQQQAKAEQLYEEALSLYKNIQIGASFTLHTVAGLADLYRKHKEPTKAVALTQSHVAEMRAICPASLSFAEALQLSLRYNSDPVERLFGFEEILQLQQSADSCIAATRAMIKLCEEKFPKVVSQYCEKCLSVLRAIHPGSWEIRELLWKLAQTSTGPEAFVKHCEMSEGLWQVQAHLFHGEWELEHSDVATALPHYETALSLLRSQQDPPPANLLEDLASFWQMAGDQAIAVQLYIETALQSAEKIQIQRAYRNAAAALKTLKREAEAEVLSEAAITDLYS